MRDQIAFIACSKTKQLPMGSSRQLPASSMYIGSLFRFALAYCRQQGFKKIYILSAKYGVLDLEEPINSYECFLADKTKGEREAWATMVQEQLFKKKIQGDFYFFTGVKYHEFFVGEKPLSGLSLGKQLQWFKRKLNKRGLGVK